MIWRDLERELQQREAAGRRRTLRLVPEGTLDAASNDYLGLARHPEVVRAAQDAAEQFGAGARASRLVSGHFALIQQLETELASFKGTETALVFSSGFAANVGVISALSNDEAALFCHKRNHASLLDGCRLAQAKGAVTRYFESPDKLRALLQKSKSPRKIVVADGVFSMDGDLLPLPEVLALCGEFEAILLLDDAHGTGTLGATGRGIEEHFGVHSERILTVGTLSKALGSQGGFVCGPRVAIDYFLGAAPSFVYSTGLNPPAVGAALAALRLLQREPGRVRRCRDNAMQLATRLGELGFEACFSGTPIIPVIIGDERAALALAAQLEARGLWCPAIRPPTVPRGTSRLRLTACSEWGPEELERIVAGFSSI
ncbi:8-amino-7-oxononanoate synthase [Abditibacteriota bacterium]|nr:8-amino-7-oxononanoate synthase [Abditibacteriota bacterium]